MERILTWDIYEMSSENHPLVGVKMRGRLRKFALKREVNFLAENAEDEKGKVRFALLSGEDCEPFKNFLTTLVHDIKVILVKESVQNPVLSKLRVNLSERYDI